MDKKDLRLVELLGQNSRLSYATLSKALSISKDAVKYRLDRLRKENIITGNTLIIDPDKLGFQIYHIFIRLKNADKKSFQEKIDVALKEQSTGFISELSGKYDLQILVYARNLMNAEKIKNRICKDNVRYSEMIMHLKMYKYSMLIPDTNLDTRYKKSQDSSFSKNLGDTRQFRFRKGTDRIHLNRKDADILKALDKDVRISLKEIGKKVGLSGEGVKKRIIKLIKNNVLIAFVANPNFSKFGYFSYCLLLKIKEDNQKIQEYYQSRDHIFYANQLTDNHSIAYILAKDPHELQGYINDMREQLSGLLLDYEILIHLDIHKFTHFPKSMQVT